MEWAMDSLDIAQYVRRAVQESTRAARPDRDVDRERRVDLEKIQVEADGGDKIRSERVTQD